MTRLILPILVCLAIRLIPVANGEEIPYVEVLGTATQSAPVDKVLWTLRIRSVDPALAVAAKSINDSYQSLKNDLEALHIPNLQLRAAEIESGREYERGDKERKFVGFYVERGLTVTVMDLARVSEVQTRLLSDDRVSISAVNRSSKQEQELKAAALQRAAEAARAKADKLAQVLKIKIGKVLIVVEGGASLTGRDSAHYITANVINSPIFKVRDDSELDEISVTQTVTVKYAIAE